jgi:hypothetical protein
MCYPEQRTNTPRMIRAINFDCSLHSPVLNQRPLHPYEDFRWSASNIKPVLTKILLETPSSHGRTHPPDHLPPSVHSFEIPKMSSCSVRLCLLLHIAAVVVLVIDASGISGTLVSSKRISDREKFRVSSCAQCSR